MEQPVNEKGYILQELLSIVSSGCMCFCSINSSHNTSFILFSDTRDFKADSNSISAVRGPFHVLHFARILHVVFLFLASIKELLNMWCFKFYLLLVSLSLSFFTCHFHVFWRNVFFPTSTLLYIVMSSLTYLALILLFEHILIL